MTVQDIAVEAGIGKRTVYLSFPSKEEAVLLSTVDRIVDRVCAEMERVAESGGTAGDTLRAMLRARVMVRFEAVSEYSGRLDDLVGSVRASLLARRAKHFEQEIEVLARGIPRARKSGDGIAGHHGGSRALVLATSSFLPYALSREELGDAKRLRKESDDVIDIVVDGITSTPRAGHV